MPLQFGTIVWPQNSKIHWKIFKNELWQLSSVNVLLTATITNFAKKLVISLLQVNVKVYLANFPIKWPDRTLVSIILFLKNGIKIYFLDLEIVRNIAFLFARTERFKKSFVIYALRTFSMDIDCSFWYSSITIACNHSGKSFFATGSWTLAF